MCIEVDLKVVGVLVVEKSCHSRCSISNTSKQVGAEWFRLCGSEIRNISDISIDFHRCNCNCNSNSSTVVLRSYTLINVLARHKMRLE